jgi:HPt (histidine-containing phosphotransfer) domain-containing protein
VGPIVSSAAAAGLDLDIVCEAERGIRAFGEQLRDALDTPDFDEIRRLAYQIRALAQSFGFARLADAADELAAACARDPRGPAVTRLAQRLRDYAARAKAVR